MMQSLKKSIHDALIVLLPGGYLDNGGVVHREVELVPLTGHGEELLGGYQAHEVMVLITRILQCCVRRIGSIDSISEEVIRRLLVADRQYLLLKLRELTLGNLIQASVFCPWSDCSKKIMISFLIDQIPVVESPRMAVSYRVELSADSNMPTDSLAATQEVCFRLPNGADQEALFSIALQDEYQAQVLLLQRCIHAIGNLEDPDEQAIAQLSPAARWSIEQEMEAFAPKLELTIESCCPECGRDYAVPFDVHNFFLGELRTSRNLLYREVHYLAFHYHWSEQEIMNMPRQKRRAYIDVLSSEIERLNHAA